MKLLTFKLPLAWRRDRESAERMRQHWENAAAQLSVELAKRDKQITALRGGLACQHDEINQLARMLAAANQAIGRQRVEIRGLRADSLSFVRAMKTAMSEYSNETDVEDEGSDVCETEGIFLDAFGAKSE